MAEQLTEEVRAELRARHAHRFPRVATMPIDGESLEYVIGNPTGVCKLPDGELADPAWPDMLAAMFVGTKDPSLGARLAEDVILWPAAATVSGWIDRWPAFPQRVADALQVKLGMQRKVDGKLQSVIEKPRKGEAPPQALESALARARHGYWRRVRVGDDVVSVALATPNGAQWRAWQTSMGSDTADLWALCRELVAATVKGIDGGDKYKTIGDVIGPMPGTVVALIGEISGSVGQQAEVELGEL